MSDPLSPSNLLDVLIIGAGSTGLTMACELWRYGLSSRIIDQAEAPSGIPKADGHVGYRSQPAEADRLLAYLRTIFIS